MQPHLRTLLLCLSLSDGAELACEKFCLDTLCSSLNGAPESLRMECGHCTAVAKCNPEAADFPFESKPPTDTRSDDIRDAATARIPLAPFSEAEAADADPLPDDCIDLAGPSACSALAAAGECTQPPGREYMSAHCARACRQCDDMMPTRVMSNATSLYDAWFAAAAQQPKQLPPAATQRCAASAALLASAYRCDAVEEDIRAKDRGFFLLASALGSVEIDSLGEATHACEALLTAGVRDAAAGDGSQVASAVSSRRRHGCHLSVEKLEATAPRFLRSLRALFSGWHATGFSRVAQLGWPLAIAGGTIRFEPIRSEQSSEAGGESADGGGAGGESADGGGADSGGAGSGGADSGISPVGDGGAGSWSMGGAVASYGRHHAALVALADDVEVRVVPSDSLYVYGGCSTDAMDMAGEAAAEVVVAADEEQEAKRGFDVPSSQSDSRLRRLLPPLSCTMHLAAGDVLFMREDTWHRIIITQAEASPSPAPSPSATSTSASSPSSTPRLAGRVLTMDVVRYPLLDLPATSPPVPPRRAHMPTMLNRLIRLPAEALSAALVHEPMLASAHRACSLAEEAASLPERGFVVARAALSPASVAEALKAKARRPISDFEIAGRHRSRAMTGSQLRVEAPGMVRELQMLLDGWDSRGLLPKSKGDHDEGTRGAADARLRVHGGQHIAIDSSESKAHGCHEERTHRNSGMMRRRECQPGIGSWHIDGPVDRPRIHKFWAMLEREEQGQGREHSNFLVTPSDALEAVAQAAMQQQQQQQGSGDGGSVGGSVGGDFARRDAVKQEAMGVEELNQNIGNNGKPGGSESAAILDSVACMPVLEPGDVLFLFEDVYHRPQDTFSDRVAMLVNVY